MLPDVTPFQGLSVLVDSLPRAALRGYAAALCPGLLCDCPFGARRASYPGRRYVAVPLRSALGYYVIAPSGREEPPIQGGA